jgi:F-box interacting protein
VNNCNGLVFIRKERENIVIWNPFIRKYKKLPIMHIQIPSGFIEHAHPKLAFRYDPVNDDYKVVRVVKFYKNR